MSRGLMFAVRFLVAVVVVVALCRFLGVTWNDVDNFIDNGVLRAAKRLSIFKGIAHTPLG